MLKGFLIFFAYISKLTCPDHCMTICKKVRTFPNDYVISVLSSHFTSIDKELSLSWSPPCLSYTGMLVISSTNIYIFPPTTPPTN